MTSQMIDIKFLLDYLSPILSGLLVLSFTWSLNEYSKRKHEDFIRKEEKYKILIENINGFYEGLQSKEKINKFINQVSLCWLYCPDSVINSAYSFLKTVDAAKKHSDLEKERALGELLVQIREDLMSKRFFLWKQTRLKSKDFWNIKAN